MTQSPPSGAYQFDVILTLDARTNILLEVITTQFRLSDSRVFWEIQQLLSRLRGTLSAKGITYEQLRPALVPQADRGEHAFVFDWAKSNSSLYGPQAVQAILPLLNSTSTHSFLCGDWLPWRGPFDEWAAASPAALTDEGLLRAGGRGDTLYFVYLNNLTRAMVYRLDGELRRCPSYIGHLDLTLATPLKGCLSTILARDFIKHRKLVIKAHEDDRPDEEDFNLSLYDFSSVDLRLRSVPSMLYGPLLSYKIERPVIPGELDTKFSLNALTPSPIDLSALAVVLDERKLQYLRKEKRTSLDRAALASLSAADIASQIHAKLQASYIYNLARALDGPTLKLNVILEFAGGVRTVCALEYLPTEQLLRVITLF